MRWIVLAGGASDGHFDPLIYGCVDAPSMDNLKVVIVGGVAGGASAAARLRRLNESAEIIMLERSGYVSYANCGLPYYVGGTISDKGKLTLQDARSFKSRFNVDVRIRNEVVSIDTSAHKVRVRRLDDGSEYDESYDRLILSPGAKAIRPDIPSMDDERVMTLRTVEDALRIREFIVNHNPRRAVVAGGGYIGLEIAENLVDAGVAVTLVQRPGQVLPPLDPEMAMEVQAHIVSKGVDLRLKSALTDIDTSDGLVAVLGDGTRLEADLMVVALGVVPDTELAKDAGLELGIKGSILVNDRMETSVPDVYAVGDAVQVVNSVTGEDAVISLAGPANRHGRIVADNICGMDSRYPGSQGSSVIKVFDMTVAMTGINEKTAKASGIRYDKTYTYSASHATYYPGATFMSIKTLFDPDTGRILGAQIVGFDGVDKRMDVLATAIRAGMTADDLAELDLSYAPPYSSAKDPVNMVGFVIGNVRAGLFRQFFWDEVDGVADMPGCEILDTRTDREYASGHVPGSLHIPVDELRDRISELDPGKTYYVICRSGLRSYIACRILMQNGIDCLSLAGGYRLYAIATGKGE